MPESSPILIFRKQVLLFLLVAGIATVVRAQPASRLLSKEAWSFRQAASPAWHPASVPGTVHTDLFRQKLIPDPYFADNETRLQWIDTLSWEYETRFVLSEQELAHERLTLLFEGLDTYAIVYLNDSLILRADNMFRSWQKEAKPYLKKGANRLRVCFEPALKKAVEEAKKQAYTLPGGERVYSRKAQYHYGWDWGPRYVTCGIWKDVKLLMWDGARIARVVPKQILLNDSLALLSFDIALDVASAGSYSLALQARAPFPERSEVEAESMSYVPEKGPQQLRLQALIRRPERWWSNGLGAATLYGFDVVLQHKGQTLDRRSLQTGLRDIELVQEPDAFGRSFYFKLNGIPVFMKGANYIPPDHFLPRVPHSSYEALVAQAKAAHMNMLRVWGGGVYADEAFYEACDRSGILVWQDLMFACAMYPGDERFLNNVKAEVEETAARLGAHPCLALWCGNNENDEGWKNWGWQKQYHYSASDSAAIWNDYRKLFDQAIPSALGRVLGNPLYWPSSPSIGWGRKESLLLGDSHYWGVWWGMEPFEAYERKVGRFMSEYGFQSLPARSTLQTIAAAKDLNLQSAAMRNHQKHPAGFQTIDTYMERDYVIPSGFEDYIYVSQLTQARGMQLAIAAHRRARPYCMGSLYWQLNDSWPVASWSSLDYYRKPKALQFAASKAFEDVLISFESRNDSLRLFLISDKLRDIPCTLSVKLMDLKGTVLMSRQQAIDLKANSSGAKQAYALKDLCGSQNPAGLVFSASLKAGDSTLSSASHLFVKPKDLLLSEPSFNIVFHRKEAFLEISSPVFASGVWIHEEGFSLSDNYFDLMPGEVKRVGIKPDKALKTDPAFVISSLYDIFKLREPRGSRGSNR